MKVCFTEEKKSGKMRKIMRIYNRMQNIQEDAGYSLLFGLGLQTILTEL